MKIKNYLLSILAVTFFSNTTMLASAQDLDGVTMELSTKDIKRGHRVQMRAHHIIFDYMLKHGDITQDQIDDEKQQRHLQRKELKHLKDSGDIDAFKERLTEIKQAHQIKREKLREYLKNNSELENILHETHNRRHGKNEGSKHKRPKYKRHGEQHRGKLGIREDIEELQQH